MDAYLSHSNLSHSNISHSVAQAGTPIPPGLPALAHSLPQPPHSLFRPLPLLFQLFASPSQPSCIPSWSHPSLFRLSPLPSRLIPSPYVSPTFYILSLTVWTVSFTIWTASFTIWSHTFSTSHAFATSDTLACSHCSWLTLWTSAIPPTHRHWVPLGPSQNYPGESCSLSHWAPVWRDCWVSEVRQCSGCHSRSHLLHRPQFILWPLFWLSVLSRRWAWWVQWCRLQDVAEYMRWASLVLKAPYIL